MPLAGEKWSSAALPSPITEKSESEVESEASSIPTPLGWCTFCCINCMSIRLFAGIILVLEFLTALVVVCFPAYVIDFVKSRHKYSKVVTSLMTVDIIYGLAMLMVVATTVSAIRRGRPEWLLLHIYFQVIGLFLAVVSIGFDMFVLIRHFDETARWSVIRLIGASALKSLAFCCGLYFISIFLKLKRYMDYEVVGKRLDL